MRLLLSILTLLMAASPANSQELTILSFNVREWTRDTDASQGTYWKGRMEAMERMIADVDPDIICFQELLPPAGRYVPDDYKKVGMSVSHPIYVRKSMKASGHRFSIFWETCLVDGIRIINVHSRWEKKVVQRTVDQVNGQLSQKSVACGDWNTFLPNIKKAGLLMESARELLGIPEEDTFANFTKPESHGAIDHFFIKGVTPLSYEMIVEGYGVDKISDHFPIVLKIRH